MGGLFFTLDIVVMCIIVYVTYPPSPLSVKGAWVAAFLLYQGLYGQIIGYR